MRSAHVLICCLLLLVSLGGCADREANRWRGSKTDQSFAVVFAPVDAAPLASIWPEGSVQFAYDLANRVDFLGRDANGWADETAPLSAGKAQRPIVGADWTVSTTLVSLDLGPSPFGPQFVAKIEMHVVDQTGKLVFLKTAHGTCLNETSPKLMSPETKPESRAAWAACSNGVSALIERIRLRSELPDDVPAATPAPVPVAVQVMVSSVPDHADVLVDGKYRGSTPLALSLPTTPVTIRIERQGHQPWSRELTPAKGMHIAPALEPVAPQVPERGAQTAPASETPAGDATPRSPLSAPRSGGEAAP
jgi:hypothetical protein